MSAIPPATQPTEPAVPSAQGAPTPPAPKKNFFARHKVLTALGAIVILIIVISIASNSRPQAAPPAGDSSGAAVEQKPEQAEEAAPGLNTPVVDGSLEFTAVSVEQAGTQVGSEYLNATAQGQFVIVTVRVTNVSDSPQTFLVNYLQLKDAQGRSYDADSMATIYAAPDSQTWVANINPGNTVEGPVVFDIPADALPTEMVVKDSILSRGTSIALK